MFLKRFIILAAGVLLAIAAFIIYFEYSKTQMEARFRAEREKYHIEGSVLQMTAASSISNAPAPAPNSTGSGDSNALIGPVPPPTSSATDTSTPTPAPTDTTTPTPQVTTPDPSLMPAPAPATGTDSNAAPAAPVMPSTLNSPRQPASVFQFAAYRPDLTPFRSALAIGQTAAAPAADTTAPAPTPQPEAPAPSAAAGNEASVIVLLYHQFVPAGTHVPAKLQWTMPVDVFASEMKYIHDNGYHVVSLSDVLAFIHHQKALPPGSVCITIDDGYKSPLVFAKPILDLYHYPWTFFIYPQFINDHPTSNYRGAASWPELLELQKEGVDIECHSMTHPTMTKKGSKSADQYAAWLVNETAGAKKVLEEHMGKTIPCFAYPYGAYNKQVEAATIAAGFEAIFTVESNPVHSTTNPYRIGRYTITQAEEKNFAAYLRQSALGIAKADPEPGSTITNSQPVITAVLSEMSADSLDPTSLVTQVRDMDVVKHDFDPATNTVRIYLPRPLVQPVEFVNIRVRDAKTGAIMVANWSFNYDPGAGATIHPPIPSSTPAPAPPPAPAPAPSATVGTSPASSPAQPKTD
jgi:peptidoglycan/xylan/chitin deacetylase (PgdA/CDA1 family)